MIEPEFMCDTERRFTLMEKEKINENTMRVTLDKEDLQEYGISVMDLISNQCDVQEFFTEILEEVDTENEFRDHGAVSFQLIPKGSGVELFITKVDPDAPEKFNLPDGADPTDNGVLLSDLTPEQIDQIGLDKDVAKILKDSITKKQKQTASKDSEATQKQAKNSQIDETVNEFAEQLYRKKQAANKTAGESEAYSTLSELFDTHGRQWVTVFDNFQKLMMLVEANDFENLDAELYKDDDKYYLVVTADVSVFSKEELSYLRAKFNEYGTESKMSVPVIQEQMELVCAQDALDWLEEYF